MTTTQTLSQTHYDSLAVGSGISDALIQQRGYRTVTNKDELTDLGFAGYQAIVPALLVPVFGTDGTNGLYQARPDNPRLNKHGKPVKYETPYRAQMALDCPPVCQPMLGDPSVPLWVTEGVKKSDSLASRGLCALALLGVWNWRGRNDADGLTVLADWEHVALNGRCINIVFDNDVMRKTSVKQALDRLTAWLRKKGAHVQWCYLPDGDGQKIGVDDWLADGHTVQELESLLETPRKNEPGETGFFSCSDMGNGARLAAWFGDDVRYCGPWQNWLVWDGQRWAVDELCQMEHIAKDVTRGIYREASRHEDDEQRKAVGKWARVSESGVRRREMIASARSEPGIAILPDALDADPWVLNVGNGTLDLRAGELRPHDRDALITKLAPVDFDENAQCPQWVLFLSQIMDNNAEMIAFLQRCVGYSLSGDVSERALFILHGTGANGKSTFLEVVRALLGDYSMSAEAKTLMYHDRGAASGDIARLKGARLVTASESERGDKLAEALVKQLTGGDRRVARALYQNETEYTPTDKLWLCTNHRPEIAGTDHAIWDRIKLIPFTVRIPEDKQDKGLKDKLLTELPGILRWAVRGCLAWQQRGLDIPDPVTLATAAYRNESDTLGAFLTDCCVTHENAKVVLKQLYDAYLAWCADNGQPNETKRDFIAALLERGYTKDRGNGNRVEIAGVGLALEN